MNNKEKFDNLIKSINWENWEKETEQCDEQVEYYDLCEILSVEIESIKDTILCELGDLDYCSTLEKVQVLLSLLTEKKIRSIL